MGAIQKPPISGPDLPSLQRNSDIMWGQWVSAAGPQKSNIKYIFSNAVTNPKFHRLNNAIVQLVSPVLSPAPLVRAR